MSEASKPSRATSAPPPDLTEARDELLRGFARSSELTQDFLDAYDSARRQLSRLREENARLRAAVDSQDAAQRLIEEIEELERKKSELDGQLNRKDSADSLSHAQHSELELELAHFANLQVASNRLHSTLSPRGVGRRIKEILEQLVGVDAYIVYLCTETGNLTPIAVEGLEPGEDPDSGPGSRLVDVMASGVSSILHDEDPSQGSVDCPPALLPLTIDDGVIGVLSIVRSLTHKKQLTTSDFELFKLLGQHAAAALMAAGLYAQADRQLPPAEAFASLQH